EQQASLKRIVEKARAELLLDKAQQMEMEEVEVMLQTLTTEEPVEEEVMLRQGKHQVERVVRQQEMILLHQWFLVVEEEGQQINQKSLLVQRFLEEEVVEG